MVIDETSKKLICGLKLKEKDLTPPPSIEVRSSSEAYKMGVLHGWLCYQLTLRTLLFPTVLKN